MSQSLVNPRANIASLGSGAEYGMTPIGSTSSNIRRAIELMVVSSRCSAGALPGTHDESGRFTAANLIADPLLPYDPAMTGILRLWSDELEEARPEARAAVAAGI